MQKHLCTEVSFAVLGSQALAVKINLELSTMAALQCMCSSGMENPICYYYACYIYMVWAEAFILINLLTSQ